MKSLRWTLIQYDQSPYKKVTFDKDTDIHREKTMRKDTERMPAEDWSYASASQ